MLILVEETGKNQLQPGQESMGVCSSVVILFSAKKTLTGVQEHCREGETNCSLSIFRGATFRPHP